MDQYSDNYISENSALRRKLQSKAEALLILSQQLEQCRVERDQFKMMAEQVQDRYMKLKKMSPDILSFDGGNTSRLSLSGRTVSQVFEELKEKNKVLQLEVEDLKQKLRDALGDMKVLRAGMSQQRGGGDNGTIPSHQREELVQQLEAMSGQCAQLQSDMQTLLDEKEELVMQRDAYKCKVHRMNHQLSILLHANPSQLFDIDALVTENKYLHEHLEQLKEENELSHQALLKYKSMLDKKRNKGSVRLGTNNCNSSGMVVSHKQVQQLLENGTPSQLPNTEATLADLRSLCLALLEALQDKSLALSHQKKSNKILANRLYDLEQRLANVQNGMPVYPSQILLNGYSGSNVDKDFQLHQNNNIDDNSDSNISNTDDNNISENICCNISEKLCINDIRDGASNNVSSLNQSPTNHDLKQYQHSKSDDDTSSTVTNAIPSETEELTVDVLPPQLQELVLNALKDIEDNQNSGS
ncbi:coiled-coil domain-containing protein 149 isoform X2 [Lycorma delicatula]|uniref:coiled-coil domain-containing protein 149 isoform X2 n=1 Tax=Lycorma delicatula TaxID=130591 RepID=UPI003F513B75